MVVERRLQWVNADDNVNDDAAAQSQLSTYMWVVSWRVRVLWVGVDIEYLPDHILGLQRMWCEWSRDVSGWSRDVSGADVSGAGMWVMHLCEWSRYVSGAVMGGW